MVMSSPRLKNSGKSSEGVALGQISRMQVIEVVQPELQWFLLATDGGSGASIGSTAGDFEKR
jgi:hypothetical protein